MQGGKERGSSVDRKAGESGLGPVGGLHPPVSWGPDWGQISHTVWAASPSSLATQALGIQFSLYGAPLRGQLPCNTWVTEIRDSRLVSRTETYMPCVSPKL